MLSSNQIAGLQYLEKSRVAFSHAVRDSSKLKIDHVILVACCRPCQGIPKVLQNNKSPMSLEKA